MFLIFCKEKSVFLIFCKEKSVFLILGRSLCCFLTVRKIISVSDCIGKYRC